MRQLNKQHYEKSINYLNETMGQIKYPIEQYNELVKRLQQLAVHLQVQNMNHSALHYIAYQQTSEGQPHNYIYVNKNNEIARAHQLDSLEGWNKLIQSDFQDFKLYPDGCHDNHVETATKKALKQILLCKTI